MYFEFTIYAFERNCVFPETFKVSLYDDLIHLANILNFKQYNTLLHFFNKCD